MRAPRLVQLKVNLPHEFSMDKPDPSHPLPVHLCTVEERDRAILAAAKERVQSYHEMKDWNRLGGRALVLSLVAKYGADEVQTWVDEARVTK